MLGGGLLADREAVRLDLDAVELDLAELPGAVERGDDEAVVALAPRPVLPEDVYEDWAALARARVHAVVGSAHRRLASAAVADERWDDVADHARALLELDPFDERAHESLVDALRACGRHGEARVAVERYEAAMAELGVSPRDLGTG